MERRPGGGRGERGGKRADQLLRQAAGFGASLPAGSSNNRGSSVQYGWLRHVLVFIALDTVQE